MKEIDQKISAYTEENIYDFDNKILLHYYPKRIIEKIGELAELSLLELGLGHGYSALEFRDRVGNYTILEGDNEVIHRFVGKYGGGANIICTFFEEYEPNEKYDFIVAGFVLEHVDDPVFILNKYKTMLKQGGKIFIAVPNAESLNRRIGYEAGILSDIRELSEMDLALGHKRYYTKESIISTCKQAELRIKSVEGIYLKPFTTKQILSLKLNDTIIESLCTVGRDYPELCVGILVECTV